MLKQNFSYTSLPCPKGCKCPSCVLEDLVLYDKEIFNKAIAKAFAEMLDVENSRVKTLKYDEVDMGLKNE